MQVAHAVCPYLRWNLPFSHRLHVSCCALGATEPGRHCVGWADPALHPPDHCDLEQTCDGDDAGFGPEGRCWGDGASWRGRDQCGVDQSFCVGGAPLPAPLSHGPLRIVYL